MAIYYKHEKSFRNVMQSLIAELTLDVSIRQHKERELLKQIDAALEQQDKQLFMQLTDDLKKLRDVDNGES